MRIKFSNFIKLFAFVAVFFITAVVAFSLNTKPAYAAPVDEGLECHWVDSGHTICTWGGNAAEDVLNDRENTTQCSGPTLFTCKDLEFNASESASFGHVVFGSGDDRIYFTTDEANSAYFWQPGSPTPTGTTATTVKVSKVSNAKTAAEGNKCSVLKTGNCDGWDQTGLDTTEFNKGVEKLAEAEELLKTCEGKAPLGFIFCPILNAVTDGIGALIGGAGIVSGERKGLLIDFLKLPVIQVTQANSLSSVVQAMVNVANVFYVVIFLVLIFSSSLPFGLDNYSIKKMLPKFIAAVILTQFSVLICAIVIDLFNLLGLLVPNIIFALTTGVPQNNDGISAIGAGLGTVLGAGLIGGAIAIGMSVGWILILVFAIVALVAAFVAVIYMIIRFLVLYVLVLLSPLAFAAWVLPGTEKFFYSWWKNFIRLNAVFMVITGLLATSIVLSKVLSDSSLNKGPGLGVGLGDFMAALLPIAALFLIPRTLKWTTDGMNKLASSALGATAGKIGYGASVAGKKGKEAAKEGFQDTRSRAAASQFGKGNKKIAAIIGGNLTTEKGLRKTSQQAAAYKEERRKDNQSALSNVGVGLQGLDFGPGAQPIENQLHNRGLNSREAARQAKVINDTLARHNQSRAAAGLQAITNGNDLYGAELQAVARGGTSQMLGVDKKSREMQVAAISEMGQRGDWGDLRTEVLGRGVSQDVFMEGIQPNFSDAITKAPDLIKGGPEPAFANISAEKITQLDHTSAAEYVKHLTSGNASVEARDNAIRQIQTIAQDPKLHGALDARSKAQLNGLAALTGVPTIP